MRDGTTSGDGLRREFGRLVAELLAETARPDGEPVGDRIRVHLGQDPESLAIFAEELDSIDLPNLQLALDAALGRPGWGGTVLGIAGQGKRYSVLSLSDFVTSSHWTVGPPEYVHADVGPGRTLACLDFAVVLVESPEGPCVVFLRRGEEQTPGGPGLTVQAVSPVDTLAPQLLADIKGLVDEVDVFRGQVITVEATPMGHRKIAFVERAMLGAGDLVLPEGVLERIERHVLGPSRHRDALVAAGRHLGRGLLLWGPPGTGKTFTVRYLTGRLTEATVIILAGSALGMVGAFGALARRLAPSVVILEDVDPVAEERPFGPYGGSSPVLFELMNEMSGHDPDADIAFILTTNRPDALEPALAARPGRVDLAVEIPLPDAAARERLLRIYARGLDVDLTRCADIVERTAGVTASCLKELLRKAALGAAEAGHSAVGGDDLEAALDELLHETAALTRVILGGGRREGSPRAHEWSRVFPGQASIRKGGSQGRRITWSVIRSQRTSRENTPAFDHNIPGHHHGARRCHTGPRRGDGQGPNRQRPVGRKAVGHTPQAHQERAGV